MTHTTTHGRTHIGAEVAPFFVIAMLLLVQFYLALMVAIHLKMSAPEPLQTTSALFILDYVDKWKIQYPKVFIPGGGKVSTDLWLWLSSRNIQAIVRSRVTDFIQVLEKDVARMEVFVSGNYSSVRYFLEKAMKSTLLNYHSTFVMVCHDCDDETEFHLNNSHDILGDVTVAIPNQLDTRLFNLYGLTYAYRCQCLKRIDLGHWSYASGFRMTTTKVSPNGLRNFKYRNAVLQVMTVELEPFQPKYDDRTGKSLPKGPLGKLLHVISKNLQFKFKIIESKHRQYGTITKDGNFTLAIGEFLENNYDLGLGVYTVTLSRKTVLDFTTIFHTADITFNFREISNDTSALWKTTFKPFTVNVWLAFAMTSFVLTITLRIANSRYKRLTETLEDDVQSWDTCRQGSTRMIILTFSIMFFMFSSYYTAVLISTFATDTKNQLRTLEDMVASDYTIVAVNGSTLYEIFQTSASPAIQALQAKQKIYIVKNMTMAMDELCSNNNMAAVGGIVLVTGIKKLFPNCTTYPMRQIPFKDKNAFITQKNQLLTKRISAILTRMLETGIMDRIFNTEELMLTKATKTEQPSINKEGWAEITIHHLRVPFSILAAGIVMSLLALLLEIIVDHQRLRKRRNRNRYPK